MRNITIFFIVAIAVLPILAQDKTKVEKKKTKLAEDIIGRWSFVPDKDAKRLDWGTVAPQLKDKSFTLIFEPAGVCRIKAEGEKETTKSYDVVDDESLEIKSVRTEAKLKIKAKVAGGELTLTDSNGNSEKYKSLIPAMKQAPTVGDLAGTWQNERRDEWSEYIHERRQLHRNADGRG